jgi:hypothetical protein
MSSFSGTVSTTNSASRTAAARSLFEADDARLCCFGPADPPEHALRDGDLALRLPDLIRAHVEADDVHPAARERRGDSGAHGSQSDHGCSHRWLHCLVE